jgi:hypothetical protein
MGRCMDGWEGGWVRKSTIAYSLFPIPYPLNLQTDLVAAFVLQVSCHK